VTTRALFVCPNLQAGGAERHWSILLPLLARRGIDVRLLTLDGRGPFFEALEAAGVPSACVADRPGRLYPRAARTMLRMPTDVVVSRAPSAHGLAALTALRPSVAWAVNWHRPPGLALSGRRRAILRAVLRRADVAVAVSASQGDELLGLGVRAEAIKVIPNGTDFSAVPDQRDAARAGLGLQDTDVAALLVGRLEPQKRVDVFVDAIARAQRSAPDVVGLVAGTGPELGALSAQVESQGARVSLLGARDDMQSVFAAADLLCLTSEFEALPFVLLEAMASALPVVASRIGDLPEVVVDNQTGILVSPGDRQAVADAIVRLAADPALRHEMGQAGLARQLEHYSAESMADQYADALREVSKHR
jgi:glycosyltransferase involved in cell wall biosynthesis